jgi:putative ABC transport system permease protein
MPAPTDSNRKKASGFFRRLLGLYPEEFRAEYATEMGTLFDDRARREPLPRLLWEVTADIFKTAPREHFGILWQDVKYALRGLRRNPAFTAVAVLSIGLGIGANSAIYTLANFILLKPLQIPAADELVVVQRFPAGEGRERSLSHADYLDLRANAKSFRAMAAFSETGFGVAQTANDSPRLVLGSYVSGNYFETLSVPAALGRTFRAAEDEAPGRDAVAVLGYAFWRDHFGADPGAVGRTVRINGHEFQVIGVAPEGFTGARHLVENAVYVPLMMAPALLDRERVFTNRRDIRVLVVRGRLAEGATVESASAELATLARNLEQAHPESNKDRGLRVCSEFQDRVDGSPPDAYLIGMLMMSTLLVLLIACANVANLLLARGQSRAKEISVRLAMGANRGRLFRQLLTESVLLAIGGGVLAIVCAYGFGAFISRMEPPNEIGIKITADVDYYVLRFNLAITLASALAFGLLPALRGVQPDLAAAMKTEARKKLWGRNMLVGAQLALSTVLLVAAAMMIAGMQSNLLQEPGFRRDHVLIASIDPSHLRYKHGDTRVFFKRLLENARTIPGVRSATLASATPTATQSIRFVQLIPEGTKLRPDQKSVGAFQTDVADGYFETIGITLRQGRGFTRGENEGSAKVAVVNEVFAERYWPGQNPIGKRFRRADPLSDWYEVIGLAAPAKYIFISEPPMPAVYFPEGQEPAARRVILLHTASDPSAFAMPLRGVVKALDGDVPIGNLRTMEDYHNRRTVSVVKILVQTVSGLGLLGLTLAAVGLFGVMSYTVTRRTKEIGIRMAIGATNGGITRLILRQAGWIAGAGAGIGLVLAYFASQALQTGFVGLAVAHPAVWVAVPVLLTAVTLLAAYGPARRAANTEPTQALRCD